MHGPEHHFLDGDCFLVTYKNAGGMIDIKKCLNLLAERTIKMPGAMCGYWGVCGSITSIGAALSIIHETGPLSNDEYYQDHMKFSSIVLDKMSKVGGPRCCKGNAFLLINIGVEFVNKKYGVKMEFSYMQCEFSDINKQCIKIRCPYFSSIKQIKH